MTTRTVGHAIMRDAQLIEPFAVQEYFVDGFIEHQVTDGILTCTAYRLQASPSVGDDPLKVVQFKVVMRLSDAIESNQRALNALQHAAAPVIPFEQKRG